MRNVVAVALIIAMFWLLVGISNAVMSGSWFTLIVEFVLFMISLLVWVEVIGD